MTRRTLGSLPFPIAAALCATVAAVAVAAGLSGCTSIALGNAAAFGAEEPAFDAALNVSGEGGSIGIAADAGPDTGTVPQGAAQPPTQSPLCGRTGLCDPDNPQTTDSAEYAICQREAYPVSADAGVVVPEDAGAIDDAAAPEGGLDSGIPTSVDAGSLIDSGGSSMPPSVTLACRISPDDAGAGVSAVCAPAGVGQDGAVCATGQDCAAGLECVVESNGGVCRHYCCANECAGAYGGDASTTNTSADAGAPQPFCNIETMAASPSNAVPVCVTKPSCVPFQACPGTGDTCTIVDSIGTTACVAEGSQGVGQSCEEAHCMGNLTCWGLFPTRTCQQLCNATNACPTGMTCQSNYSNFGAANQGLGICSP